MPFDENLANRMRVLLDQKVKLSEKRMFGGIGFLLNGNLVCGVQNQNVIARIGPDNYASALEKPFTKPFDMTGRPMAGWVEVLPEGAVSDTDLMVWLQMSLDFAATLLPK